MRPIPAGHPATLVMSFCLVTAALVGCAGTASPPSPEGGAVVAAAAPAPAASGVHRVCTRERPINSTMAQTVCRNVDEHGDAADTVEALNRTMTNGNAGMRTRAGTN